MTEYKSVFSQETFRPPTRADFSVTLAALRFMGACFNGYNKVVRAIQGREFSNDDRLRESYIRFAHKDKIPLLQILESNGLDDALWALRCGPGCDRDARLFAVWCARQVQCLMTDKRSVAALDVAERFANGQATENELAAARDAARYAARDAARAKTWDATRDATRDAARAAAWDTAWDAAWAGARYAARAKTWNTARAAQTQMFIAMCNGSAQWQEGLG